MGLEPCDDGHCFVGNGAGAGWGAVTCGFSWSLLVTRAQCILGTSWDGLGRLAREQGTF